MKLLFSFYCIILSLVYFKTNAAPTSLTVNDLDFLALQSLSSEQISELLYLLNNPSLINYINQIIPSAIPAKSLNLLTSLLPLYGGFKLSRFVTAKSYESIKKFFKSNPQIYQSFRTELATEGVFLPELSSLNWDVLTANDYANALLILGNVDIRTAITEQYLSGIEAYINSHPEVVDRFKEVIAQAGITYVEPIDGEGLKNSALKVFIPNISSFLPTIVSIVIFG